MWKSVLRSGRWVSTCFRSSPQERVDCVVVGAGVVGLAVARELALKGRDVFVIEAGPSFGTCTSSRSSEVIHSGVYYSPKSLKATLCTRGKELLYRYCSEHCVPHQMIGKLIVATSIREISRLIELFKNGCENGISGLQMMAGHEVTKMEPELQCVKAVFSPCSGIVDSHSLMLSFLGEAESFRTTFSYNTTVTHAHVEGVQIYLHIYESKELQNSEFFSVPPQMILLPKTVINSAGLGAISLANRIHGLDPTVIPPSYYARGCYFSLSQTRFPPFKKLIYPLPEDGGLGVHVTQDLDGRVRFGPDVEWIDGIDGISSFLNKFDYTVKHDRTERFYPEIRKYFPSLKDGALEPAYSGIRVKLSGPGQPPVDFMIQVSKFQLSTISSAWSETLLSMFMQGEDVHGVPGLINLFGIESPGLTSSMAIAEYVAARV